MALSWAMIQVLAAVPSVPEGETKKPPVSPPLRSFSFLLFQLLSPFGVQTELKQQLHTPDAQSIGQGTFCCGGNKPGLTLQRNRTPQWFSPPSRFFWAVFPPILCLLTHLSHAPSFAFFPFWVQQTGPGNIYFALVVVNKFWLKQQEHTWKSCVQLRRGITLINVCYDAGVKRAQHP